MLSFALCATHSVTQAQSSLRDGADLEGYWTVSSKWASGSNSGTVGFRGGFGGDGEATTGTYDWDYKTQDFTGAAPSMELRPYITTNITFGNGSISGNEVIYAQARSTSLGTVATAKASGTAEFTYNWVPTVPGGKPSKDLHILISGKAGADVFVMTGGDGSPTTGKVWASVEGKPKDDPQEQPVVTSPSKTALGGKLFTVSKDELSFTTNFSLEAGADTPGFSRGRPIDAMAYLEAATRADNRSVTLSRDGAHDEWSSNEGGVSVTHGATIYSYNTYSTLYPDGEWYRANHHFASHLNGDWSSVGTAPRVTWNWSDGSPLNPYSSYADGKYTADRQSPFGGLSRRSYFDANLNSKEKWTGTGIASQTATMTYDVEDQGDGAKATAKYILEIHEPIEKLTDNSYPIYAYFPLWGSGASPTNPQGVMQLNGPFSKDGQNNPSVGTATGESHGTSIGVSGEFGPEDVGAALGLSAEWSSETSTSVERNWPLNIDVGADEFAFPVVQDKYIRHNIVYRHFDVGGEHQLPLVESPPGSGIYILPLHQIVKDEFTGRNVVWNKLPQDTGVIPPYSPDPVAPDSTDPSGGSA